MQAVVARLAISDTTDPYANLAMEEALTETVEPGECILYLWRNARTIVIGRNQNPWKECRVEELEAAGGHLARRKSGGGAVYHDEGNLNFSFIACDGVYDVGRHLRVICAAVRSFGLDAELSGRNDILVGGAKFSGNAFFHSGARHCHHGTLMIGVDTGELARYLKPDARKLASKGVKSVRSRVVNLASLNPSIDVDSMGAALREAFAAEYASLPAALPAGRISRAQLEERRERFASWEWRFGSTVDFTHSLETRFGWGCIDIELVVDGGIVGETRIFSDALDAGYVDQMAHALRGVRYGAVELVSALEALPASTPEEEAMRGDVVALIRAELLAPTQEG